jgi:hypothetical protein
MTGHGQELPRAAMNSRDEYPTGKRLTLPKTNSCRVGRASGFPELTVRHYLFAGLELFSVHRFANCQTGRGYLTISALVG